MGHGNELSNGFPKEVRLGEVEAPSFQVVYDFMCTRELSVDVVGHVADVSHPVLEMADRYDLQELKDGYLAIMLEREPLTLPTAVRWLEVAIRHNIKGTREQAVVLLAQSIHNVEGKKQFLTLAPELAGEVIALDELSLDRSIFSGDRHFRESEAVKLVREWVAKDPERTGQAWQVLQHVRFELLGFKELTELQDGLGSDKEFCAASTLLSVAIRTALEKKPDEVSAVARPLRKRNFTALVDGAAEEDCAKVLRVASSLKLFNKDAT